MVCKSPDAFRTISEVSDWLELPTHVLRFWESKISQISPVKRAGGRRYYRPSDMLLLGGIKFLLYEQGLTIRALKQKITSEGQKSIATYSQPLNKLKIKVSKETVHKNSDKPTIESISIQGIHNKNEIPVNISNLNIVNSENSETLLAIRRKLRKINFHQSSKKIILGDLFRKLVLKRNTIAESLTNSAKTQY
jgi:DNA-binding transcriptional MerR regulator|tara:strand:+ start:1205 stop:1783 length:579 start_codon:yes stop_codon:yes gene_type:complete